MCYFLREATSEIYEPRVYFPIIYLHIYIAICLLFYLHLLFSDLYYQKPKNTSLCFICRYLHISIYHNFYPVSLTISGTVTQKGLTTPLTRRVASICFLSAGVVYVVLGGSPTGSITLVSSLREIPTVAVLHHPFLFGEIST